MVQEESSWLVRLDSYQNAGGSPVRYEHPVTWTVEELSAILSRLLLEDRVGLMDSSRPQRPVFSVEEIGLLAPAIRHSFQQAKPSEWIAFYFSQPIASGLAATSGGIFVADSRLHVVLANHHAVMAGGSEELASIRTNPLRSVRGSGGMLTFESPRFVMGRQANWSGGHRASASELILDHRGVLSFLKLPGAVTAPSLPVRPVLPVPSSEPRNSQVATEESDPRTVILRLQEEVERLKRKVDEQEAEIARLKEKR